MQDKVLRLTFDKCSIEQYETFHFKGLYVYRLQRCTLIKNDCIHCSVVFLRKATINPEKVIVNDVNDLNDVLYS